MTTYVVTGAGGSIGSVICEQLVQGGAKSIRLVSLTESGLYNVERRLRALNGNTEIVGILGSVCDESLMREVCENADAVIHAAAHKHVPICEVNPIAAIENNVRGTLTIATVAENAGVGQFLLISSDKAVLPASVMGMTKRAAEMIVLDKASRSTKTIFSAVRFGNVLDSSGSVLPLWREQIARGGPITLTDERCERYFMSIPEACSMVLDVLSMKAHGTFVFDMGEPRRLIDIARQLIAESGLECEIQFIGLRPGEKLTEELHFGGTLHQTAHPKILEVRGENKSWQMSALLDMLHFSSCRLKGVALHELRAVAC